MLDVADQAPFPPPMKHLVNAFHVNPTAHKRGTNKDTYSSMVEGLQHGLLFRSRKISIAKANFVLGREELFKEGSFSLLCHANKSLQGSQTQGGGNQMIQLL